MAYDVGEVLKKCRNNSKMSVKQISDILTQKGYKASESTIYSWENGNSQPTPGALLIMCQEYGVSDILSTFGYDGYNDDGSIQLNLQEIELIEKYRTLDQRGQATVSYILNREAEHMAQLEQAPATVVEASDSVPAGRVLQYFHSVSAGAGEVLFDDVYTERITVPDRPQYRRVAYAVKVSGHSMEPLYHDKDILLVEPTCEISVGEIGIFNVNGQAYVKKLGKGKLISLNKGYDDIPLTEESLCMGRVVDSLKS